VRVGKEKEIDEALEKAASEYGLKWHRSKDRKNEVHIEVNVNAKMHWKFRTGRAEGAFNIIRRLIEAPAGGETKGGHRQAPTDPDI